MNYCFRFSILLFLMLGVSTSSFSHADSTKIESEINRPAKQPNVIFVLVDDLGWGDLGVFFQNESTHDRKHKTPHLDKMAAEGMQLRAHYCPAPVCAPSRASLLLGVHQGNAEIRNNQFDKALPPNHTIGSMMKAAGYRTAMIGKYGLQGKGDSAQSWPAYPTKRGFDEFFGYVRHVDGHLHYPAHNWPLGNSESHQTPKEVWWNENEVSANLQKCYTTDLFTARSKKWIQQHQEQHADKPFFLCLTYDTPHAALQVPSVPYPAGLGINGGIQWTGEDGKMINTAVGEIDSFRHPDYTGKGWSDVEERFATMVRRIDNAMGDLLQTLRDLKIEDNTMVVFTSDNGPHHESYLANSAYNADSFRSFGPFDGTKRDTWEGGIRMPTLAWWPGKIASGKINNQPSQFHDWMPTLAHVASTPAPARTDGVSLYPSLTGGDDQDPSKVYIEYFNGSKTPPYETFLKKRHRKKRGDMQVIFMDGFKGVRTNIQKHDDPFEIYDVVNDPGERNNLAQSSERFTRLGQRMKDEVLRLRKRNDSAKRPYDSEPIPGYPKGHLKRLGATVSEDVCNFSTYEGDFKFVPNTASLSPLKTGQGDVKDIPRVNGATQISVWINAAETGNYEISFSNPTKFHVRLHKAELFDGDFDHKNDQYKKTVKLGKGFHPIQITMLSDDQSNDSYQLSVQPKEKK
jgi:uncharacterized sulfatase